MIRVNVKDLEGKKILEYDLYTENGRLIFHQGIELTPGKILQLSYVKIFRKEEEQPVVQVREKVVEKPAVPEQSMVGTTDILPEPPDWDSVMDQEVRKEMLTCTRSFLKDIECGKSPDVAVCELMRDKLVEEVADKVEQVDYLGQLRMFDEYTYSHNVNVSALSVALGMKLNLKQNQIKDLALATLLHDIGKMRIPKEVLNKPGKLTDKEFQIMKLHAPLGYKVIKDELKLPSVIYRVALEHQERFSGTGYPKGIKGDEISLYAQICAIADVYDALCSKRVYKPSRTSKESIKIMLSEGSASFNPGLLYKFIQLCNYSDS
jgi:HD-GYP domain-containing protein (c-di-GMP phosphodiesterase class II)